MQLSSKHIVLGISGGIAAYKCPELVRRLREQGAEVRVIMTEAAQEFITPLTLQAVSGFPVSHDLFDSQSEMGMGHIELAKWADLVLIVPASADIIARLASGLANDLLTTMCLATAAPIAIAPAMNQQMYQAKATQANLLTLNQYGFQIWGPDSGDQACGDIGPGRLLDIHELVNLVKNQLICTSELSHLRILLTAGPTQEALDPVRFISNNSSGRMGFAIAQAAAERGAEVILISGPVNLPTPRNVQRINVITANEMYNEVMQYADKVNIFISCAAVSDYRPAEVSAEKIKKSADHMVINLVRNPDIVAQVAALQNNRPFVVGFAAETQNIAQNAQQKLVNKKLDLICANDVSQLDKGFGNNRNELHLFWHGGDKQLFLSDKYTLSHNLLNELVKHYEEKNRCKNT